MEQITFDFALDEEQSRQNAINELARARRICWGTAYKVQSVTPSYMPRYGSCSTVSNQVERVALYNAELDRYAKEILGALECLDPDERETLVRTCLKHEQVAEAADVMGISKSTFHRIKKEALLKFAVICGIEELVNKKAG